MADPLPYPLYGGDTVDPDIIDFDDIEIPLRDKTEAGNAQHKKVIGADLKASFLGTIPEDVAELKTPVQKVVLVRPDGTRIWFKATDSSEAAGEIALRNALSQWSTGSKVIICGGFCSVTGTPLKSSLPSGSPSIPGQIIFFEDTNCGVKYSDEALAEEDGNAELFGDRIHIWNFGCHPTNSDNGLYLNSAIKALPRYSGTPGEFGNIMRRGVIDVTEGNYITSRQLVLNNNLSFGEGLKTGRFVLRFKAGYAPSSGPTKYGVVVERFVAYGGPASNFTHLVNIENVNINCEPTDNEHFKPLYLGCAQLSQLDNILIGKSYSGIDILNFSNSLNIPKLWINGPITRGPGINMSLVSSSVFGVIANEHHLRDVPITNGEFPQERGRTIATTRLERCWCLNFGSLQFEDTPGAVELNSSHCVNLGVVNLFNQTQGWTGEYAVRMINSTNCSVQGMSTHGVLTGLIDQTADEDESRNLSNFVTRAIVTAPGVEFDRRQLPPYYQTLHVKEHVVTMHGPGYGQLRIQRTDTPGAYTDTLSISSAGSFGAKYFAFNTSGPSGVNIPAISINGGVRGYPFERAGLSLGISPLGHFDVYIGGSTHFQKGIRAIPKAGQPIVSDFSGETFHAKLYRNTSTSPNTVAWYMTDGTNVYKSNFTLV